MIRFYLIFSCFLISQLLIGQSDLIVIWDKKSGKESTLNEGDDIRVVTKGRAIFKGKLNKIFYDSALNSTMLKIDNTTIPYDAVKSIKKSVKASIVNESKSLLIRNKKSGKESTLNEGDDIRVVTKGRNIYKGKLNEILYDSSLYSTMIKINNTTIPIEAVKYITYNNEFYKSKLAAGRLFSTLGPLVGFWSLYKIYYGSGGFYDALYLIPAAISGVISVSGIILLGTTPYKYKYGIEVKKAKGG
ncbi:hypothetical protein OA958_01035 [Bacteroidota bacterium]|nr:hypothetical protein [Bacteroidota bacterium]